MDLKKAQSFIKTLGSVILKSGWKHHLSPVLVDRLPDSFGRQRHVQVLYTEGLQCIDHSVGYRSAGSDRSCFAGSFYSQRIVWTGSDSPVQLIGDHHMGFWHSVIKQFAGDQLTVFIIDRIFPERLPDSLSDAAMKLAFDDHRVDHVPDIVHG